MSENKDQLPFGKKNFLWILIGAGLIALGYFLMATENFVDANEFSLALYVCPVMIIAGHVVVIYGILIRDKVAPALVEDAPESKPSTPADSNSNISSNIKSA